MRTLLFCNLSLIGISLVNAAAVDNDLLLNPDGSLEGIDPNVSPPNKLISPNFPPSSYLGFSLDTTATMPLDIDSITTSVKTFKRLIRLPTDGQVRSFAGGAKWKVPTSVTVKETHQDASTKIKSFPEGSVAAKAFDDPEGWEIITGEEVNDAVSKAFQEKYQYALYEYNAPQLQVKFLDYKKDVEWPFLSDSVKRQPSPFDSSDAKIVESYRKFFNLLGTHVIVGVSFGARMTCAAWASNADPRVNENFLEDVKASFNGLVGNFNEEIKGTDQYARFQNYVQELCTVSGGDEKLAAPIEQYPQGESSLNVYTKWLNDAGMKANITGFQTLPIWVLMTGADDARLAQRAEDFRTAYTYFVTHPQKHVTKCRLTVNSDWGDMNLLTPSAYIQFEDSIEPPNGTYYSSTKVGWQSPETPPVPQRDVVIDFLIINDGTPIDIDLSHGTVRAEAPGTGNIQVSIGGIRYENDKTTGSPVNRVPYYNLAVYPWPRIDALGEIPSEASMAPEGGTFLRGGAQPATEDRTTF